MATVESSEDVHTCARDFILDRLEESDGMMSPSELAEEYGCTNDHVRHVLTELRDEGKIERPRFGWYTSSQPASDGDEDTEDPQSDTDFLSGGGPRSEDLATEDQGAQDGETVPSKNELDRQREQYADDEPDDDRDEQDEPDDDHDADEVEETSESVGIPIPVDGTTLMFVAAGVLVVALLYAYTQADSGSESVTTEQPEQDQQDDQEPSGGGLVSDVSGEW